MPAFRFLPAVASLLAIVLGALAGYILVMVFFLIVWPEETLYLLRTLALMMGS